MNEREQRGLVIAASYRIRQKGGVWLVPSQTGNGKKYTVSLDDENPHCSCPDHETRGCRCKHIYAAQYVLEREFDDDGTVTETETLVLQTKRKTYRQDWPAYNRAQTGEKAMFQVLLHDLCKSIPEPKPNRIGRPRIPLADAIFSAVFKVFSTVSGRRFISDLRDAQEKGYVRRVPHFNSIFNVFDAPETCPILTALVAQSAAPLKSLETNFAVDSSGFSGCRFDRWYDEKWGQAMSKRTWVKAHAMVGVKTNVITAVQVLGKDSGDSPQLQPLMNVTLQEFTINDLTADMAYLSEANMKAIVTAGATPLIPFKSNSAAKRPGIWNKMFHFYQFNRDEFLSRYHQRSNIESTFSMLKRKFGDSVRSKTDLAMRNEVLAKVVCHNLCCLIQSMEEFGIDPTFGCTNTPALAQNVVTI